MPSTLVGCDIGGTSIKVVSLAAGRVVSRLEVPSDRDLGPRAFAARIAAAVASVLRGRRARRPAAIGVAVPGFLDAARRGIVRLSNLPRLDGAPLGRLLEQACGAPVVLDADTNAGAVAEARRGAGRRRERVLYVTLGTGLGAAFVVAGAPVRVSRHTIGQVAHWELVEPSADLPVCYCGARGCAETLLSARGVLWQAARLGWKDATSPLELCRLARQPGRGREAARARRLWRAHGDLLGRLLHTLCAFLSPDAIVVGGGLAGAAPLFLPAATARLAARLTPALRPAVELRAARLGTFAGAIGAALLAADGGSVQGLDGDRRAAAARTRP